MSDDGRDGKMDQRFCALSLQFTAGESITENVGVKLWQMGALLLCSSAICKVTEKCVFLACIDEVMFYVQFAKVIFIIIIIISVEEIAWFDPN